MLAQPRLASGEENRSYIQPYAPTMNSLLYETTRKRKHFLERPSYPLPGPNNNLQTLHGMLPPSPFGRGTQASPPNRILRRRTASSAKRSQASNNLRWTSYVICCFPSSDINLLRFDFVEASFFSQSPCARWGSGFPLAKPKLDSHFSKRLAGCRL